MVINIMGIPFYILFITKRDKEFNELWNFTETHNLHLKEVGEVGKYTINDVDYTPDKKDVTRLLKILKDSGHWDAYSYQALSDVNVLTISYIQELS